MRPSYYSCGYGGVINCTNWNEKKNKCDNDIETCSDCSIFTDHQITKSEQKKEDD